MRIDKGQLIAGYPVLKVRDFFKRYEQYSVANAAYFFALSASAAKALCLELVDLGYSYPIPAYEILPDNKEIRYDLQPLGRSLRLARAVKPLPRHKADEIFAAFINRVREVNADDKYLYKVDKVLLFGSYIRPEVQEVGDIDIAMNLISKFEDSEVRLENDLAYAKLAMKNGRRLSSWIDQLLFAQGDTQTYLRGKSRYLSLHPMTDGVLGQTKTVQVYPKPNRLIDWVKRLVG